MLSTYLSGYNQVYGGYGGQLGENTGYFGPFLKVGSQETLDLMHNNSRWYIFPHTSYTYLNMPFSTSVCEDCWRLRLTLWTTSGPIPDLWQAFSSSSSTNHTNHVMKYLPAIICNYSYSKHITKASHLKLSSVYIFFIFVLSVHEDRRHLCRGGDRCHRLLLSLRGTPLHDAGPWWWWWGLVLSSKLAWEETSCLRQPQLQPNLAEPVNALVLGPSIDEKHEDDEVCECPESRHWWSCVSIKKSGGNNHPHCCRWTTKRSASATKRTSFSAS